MKFLLFVIIAVSLTSASQRLDSLQFGPFGKVFVYFPSVKPENVVIFVSGDGGWNQDLISKAGHLVDMNSVVAGIDINHYFKTVELSNEKCLYPAADFENLSKYIQKKYGFTEYKTPVLLGYSSGASLVYAASAQAPEGTFKGSISMGFVPEVLVSKQFCKGSGLQLKPFKTAKKGFLLLPDKDLKTPWIVLQGQDDKVCSASRASEFVNGVGSGKIIVLPKTGHGFSVEKDWLPQFTKEFMSLTGTKDTKTGSGKSADHIDSSISNLPIVEVQANGKQNGMFAVMLSGDGGWAGIDRSISASLANAGIPVAGFNSLQYFWTARTPEKCAEDIGRVINHYVEKWKKDTVILLGYSFGADVLPFIVNRLPESILQKVKLVSYVSLSKTADFQFSLSDWLGTESTGGKPVLPELQKLKGRKMLAFYGTEESDALGKTLDPSLIKTVPIEGGHHLGGKFDLIAREIIKEAQTQ